MSRKLCLQHYTNVEGKVEAAQFIRAKAARWILHTYLISYNTH